MITGFGILSNLEFMPQFPLPENQAFPWPIPWIRLPLEMNDEIWDICHETVRYTMELNNKYHTQEEIAVLMDQITHGSVGEGFRMFPPFYADFGPNLYIGRNVFLNSGCHFQNQGGIYIGDGTLIGHNVVLATINHDLDPQSRKNHYAPIHIGKNVWIGSNATILPGVTIGDGAVAAASSVIHDDLPANAIVGGVPAGIIREHWKKQSAMRRVVSG